MRVRRTKSCLSSGVPKSTGLKKGEGTRGGALSGGSEGGRCIYFLKGGGKVKRLCAGGGEQLDNWTFLVSPKSAGHSVDRKRDQVTLWSVLEAGNKKCNGECVSGRKKAKCIVDWGRKGGGGLRSLSLGKVRRDGESEGGYRISSLKFRGGTHSGSNGPRDLAAGTKRQRGAFLVLWETPWELGCKYNSSGNSGCLTRWWKVRRFVRIIFFQEGVGYLRSF